MDGLSIYNLVMIIRGFSNEITARGLANKLGVSYSTLARCKSGNWPRSITLDAMREAFDDCRERFFDGDGEVMASSILMHLKSDGIDPRGLERVLDQKGYDGFITTLLVAAKQDQLDLVMLSGADKTDAVEGGDAPEREDALSEPPAPAPNVSSAEDGDASRTEGTSRAEDARDPGTSVAQESIASGIRRYAHDMAMVAPVALLLLLGMSGASVSSMVSWASAHRLTFFAISTAIAVLPALVGIAVDSPIAWHRWRRTHPGVTPASRDLVLIAKFGDNERLVPLEGRFNLTSSYLAYQPVCNLLSMMCYASLLAFLLTMPGFVDFFATHEFVEYFKAGAVVSYYIAYQFMREQYARPFAGEFGLGICENPDNYLPSRFHMWANILHLVWTGSVLIVLLLGLIAYSTSTFRQAEVPVLMLWPYLQLVLYFCFSSASPYAVRIRAQGAGVMLPGIVAASVGFAALALVCYLPSVGGALLCAACVASTVLALAWVRRLRGGEMADWLDQSRASSFYPAVFTATIVILLAVSMVTFTFA